MILVIDGVGHSEFQPQKKQMFQLRAKTFQTRLSWDVKVQDNMEIDELDELLPVYVLSMRNDKVVGCLRMLPTTGPTLLAGPLAPLFDDCVNLMSPLIWEGTRFAVDEDERLDLLASGVRKPTVELLMGAAQVMEKAGICFMLGVIDIKTMRICKRTGWVPSIMARSTTQSGLLTVLWEKRADTLEKLIERHGFEPEACKAPAFETAA